MVEKFLSTLPLMFIFSFYFIYNTCRDTAAEKEFDIVIQMTLEHARSSSEIREKRNGQKNNF